MDLELYNQTVRDNVKDMVLISKMIGRYVGVLCDLLITKEMLTIEEVEEMLEKVKS